MNFSFSGIYCTCYLCRPLICGELLFLFHFGGHFLTFRHFSMYLVMSFKVWIDFALSSWSFQLSKYLGYSHRESIKSNLSSALPPPSSKMNTHPLQTVSVVPRTLLHHCAAFQVTFFFLEGMYVYVQPSHHFVRRKQKMRFTLCQH